MSNPTMSLRAQLIFLYISPYSPYYSGSSSNLSLICDPDNLELSTTGCSQRWMAQLTSGTSLNTSKGNDQKPAALYALAKIISF